MFTEKLSKILNMFTLKIVLLGLLIVYSIAVYIMHFKLSYLLFPATPLSEITHETSHFEMPNGGLIRIYGNKGSPCLIFLSGQRGGVNHYEQTLFNEFQRANYQVFAVSYPGQDGGQGRVNDLDSLITEIKQELKNISLRCVPHSTIIYGRSLGATLALYSANVVNVSGLILEGASSSLDSAIYHYLDKKWYLKPLALLPIKSLLKENYSLLDALTELPEKPVVIYQGELDSVTPLHDLTLLFHNSYAADLKVITKGYHHNTYELALMDIIETANHMVKK